MLATLKLLSAGWRVTAVDARESYGREIHLSLRQSYIDTVRRIDDVVGDTLEPLLSPIAEIQHVGHPTVVPRAAALPEDAGVRRRLEQPPVVHVRLDALERCFYARLEALAKDAPDRLALRRGSSVVMEQALTDDDDDRAVGCSVDGKNVDADLVVIAEGGKSATARRLRRSSVPLSRHALYISVHVDDALGPFSRRLDSLCALQDGREVMVSAWATGHRDPSLGTWLVVEIPDELHGERASKHFHRAYFDDAAMRLLDITTAPTVSTLPFSGTFRFEQQLNPLPTAGTNLVFLGDAAGMGHHALSTGLELGAVDMGPLSQRLAGGTQREYREAMVRSRIEMLAFGMREYHPGLHQDPTPWIVDALRQRDVEPRAYVDARIVRLARPPAR
jgi:2-polyprenyl-6-methoxyphenol hydroxylase-like FAD-dependent oxidoreductase